MNHCTTCELTAVRNAKKAPLWDNIYRTDFWDVVHSYNTALPGWLVLVARRHLEAIDELTEQEATELGMLIRGTSIAIKAVTNCLKTYVIQFAEATEHPHVHFHVVPRQADMPEAYRSVNVFKYLGVPVAERVDEAKMNQIAAEVKQILLGVLN